MKLISFVTRIALPALVILIFSGCNNNSGKIPFDIEKARLHVRPYKVLKTYIDSFAVERARLYARVKDRAYIDSSFKLADAEMFNRDAIIALLDAPGAQGIRIYLGKKTTRDSTNGNIVMVILPVDAKNNDIKTKLIVTDRNTALHIPGISAVKAQPTIEAEGLDDGQRCPTVCNNLD